MSNDEFVQMAMALWAIWHARRKAIHEDIFQSPMNTHGFIKSYLAELKNLKPRPPPLAGVRLPRSEAWIEPRGGLTKFNVDAGVSVTDNCGSVGVICKKRDGTF